jgi:hypothetical protein
VVGGVASAVHENKVKLSSVRSAAAAIKNRGGKSPGIGSSFAPKGLREALIERKKKKGIVHPSVKSI